MHNCYILLRERLLFTILCCIVLVPIAAQTVIDGHTAFYDSLTDTYLVSTNEPLTDVPDTISVSTTTLPIIQLTGTFSKSYSEGMFYLAAPDGEETSYNMKAKYRGNSTNQDSRHKRNFHLKFLDAAGDKKNVSLLGLRNDNSYLLDAGQVDLGRIRNHVAQELWRDIDSKPYYAALEDEAKTYIGCEFAEVFINDEYFGLYSLTEAMDRKQLQIKKYDDSKQTFHGMLYKGEDWTYTDMYGPFDEPDDTSETWGGYTVEYPEFDDVCPTDWSTLYDACVFTDESSPSVFAESVAEYFDLPVVIDYHLFHLVLCDTDHGGKNTFWAAYDVAQSPMLTPVPWDYDTTLGQRWNNDAVHSPEFGPTRGDIYNSAWVQLQLINRLISENTNDIVHTIIARYFALRETVFAEESLTARYNDYFDMLRAAGTLDRETQRWSGDTDIAENVLDFDDEQQYIASYIPERLAYLDDLFTTTAERVAIVTTPAATTNNARYNLQGQQVANTYKGIVITQGKKLLYR